MLLSGLSSRDRVLATVELACEFAFIVPEVSSAPPELSSAPPSSRYHPDTPAWTVEYTVHHAVVVLAGVVDFTVRVSEAVIQLLQQHVAPQAIDAVVRAVAAAGDAAGDGDGVTTWREMAEALDKLTARG